MTRRNWFQTLACCWDCFVLPLWISSRRSEPLLLLSFHRSYSTHDCSPVPNSPPRRVGRELLGSPQQLGPSIDGRFLVLWVRWVVHSEVSKMNILKHIIEPSLSVGSAPREGSVTSGTSFYCWFSHSSLASISPFWNYDLFNHDYRVY